MASSTDKPPTRTGAESRDARLARALRENLRRRKAPPAGAGADDGADKKPGPESS